MAKQKPQCESKRKARNKQYDEKFFKIALEAVRMDTMGLRKASIAYSVPYSTLNDHYHNRCPQKYGRPVELTEEEESTLSTAFKLCAEWGFPLRRKDSYVIVQQYLNSAGKRTRFPDNKPGRCWFLNFMARHPTLSEKFSQNIKNCRAAINEEIVRAYFDNLENTVEGIPAANIINYDETNFTDDPLSERVRIF